MSYFSTQKLRVYAIRKSFQELFCALSLVAGCKLSVGLVVRPRAPTKANRRRTASRLVTAFRLAAGLGRVRVRGRCIIVASLRWRPPPPPGRRVPGPGRPPLAVRLVKARRSQQFCQAGRGLLGPTGPNRPPGPRAPGRLSRGPGDSAGAA